MNEVMRWLGLALVLVGIAGLLMRKGWVGRTCMALGIMSGLELFMISLGRGLLGVGTAFLTMVTFFALFLVSFALLLKGRRQ